ncbi:MAG: hypothetical protein KF784_14745 [Fimbriimonadaceae bacterium]|nr:hypothetical protein [Fimbriimonadaceae bacterium]
MSESTPIRSSRFRLFGLLVLVIGLSHILVSCGGSGGGQSPSLAYRSDWTNRSRAVTGLSQRIALYNLNGVLVSTSVMNQDENGLQATDIQVASSGSYRLLIELFSQRDLAGVKTGVIDTLVNIQGKTQFLSAVGEDPTSVKVSPSNANLTVQQSRQFYACGYNGSNRAVFTEPGSMTWTTLGGVASVNTTGLVLGTSQGDGSVRAQHLATSTQGSGLLHVNPFTTTTTKWTILVFINAANDLAPFSTLNVNQMEKVASNPDVRFVLQWKQSTNAWPSSTFNGTRRYLVKPDLSNQIASELIQDMGTDVDMGQASTLLNFINWGKTFYPADRYCLIIWNHGSGWKRTPALSRAVSFDDETGNAIQTWELSQSIGNNVLDIVAWDASLMQMMEVAFEIKDRAQYVVGSEESPPGEGYPYDAIFAQFRDNPDASTRQLTKAFVDGMLNNPSYVNRKITQSSIETAKLGDLATALDGLAAQLIANEGTIGTQIQNIRSTAQAYSPTSFRVFRDIGHLCDLINAQIAIPSVQNAALNVKAKLQAALAWEGHNINSPNSQGLSIDFSSSSLFNTLQSDYAQLLFAQTTLWDDWLQVAP